jgi:hypothetical protein
MLFNLYDDDEHAVVLAIVRSLVKGDASLSDRTARFLSPEALHLLLSPQLFTRLTGACRSQVRDPARRRELPVPPHCKQGAGCTRLCHQIRGQSSVTSASASSASLAPLSAAVRRI